MRTPLLITLFAATTMGVPDFETSEAGNPFVQGWYADPDNEFYNGEYWVYATTSAPYDDQTYLDAFSTPDLVHWTKHARVLDQSNFPWAKRAIWAPAPIARHGKYYLYFAANDIQTNDEYGGIGVGVADAPEGPYTDPLGEPLIGAYYNGAQPIDQDVFIDDDGQAYMYYGGHSHANVAKINEDMITVGTFDDGTQYKEITPENYVEGPQMMKRNGVYYLFWSEGGWTGPDYAVSYGMSTSPLGPFKREAKILEQDLAVATGSGHNGVIRVPGTDIHYIVYHRHPLGDDVDGSDRHLCYDRLVFDDDDDDGKIQPVKMLVHDNFADGNTIGWTSHGGKWDASSGSLRASSSGINVLNTNFGNFQYSAGVAIAATNTGDAGLVFRVSDAEEGAYNGYYAGISTSRSIVVGRADGEKWTQLARVHADIRQGKHYTLTVRADGDTIAVGVHAKEKGYDMSATLQVRDATYTSGMDGLRVHNTDARFDNVKIDHI